MDKLLVIGSGLLGSKAIEIGRSSYETYGTYNTNGQEDLVHLDVENKEEVSKVLNKIRPDIVLDTHALNNMDYCETHRDSAWGINVTGSRNVGEECLRIGAKYAFFSTDYVFDGKQQVYTEEDMPNPISYYGKTKWMTEEILKVIGVDMIAVRTSSIYGTSSSSGKKSFVQWVIDSVRADKSIKVMSDIYNSPTLNADLAAMTLRLCELDSSGIFHIVGSDNVSKYDFAKGICNEFGLDSSLIEPERASEIISSNIRPGRVLLDTGKVESITNSKPLGIKDGLALVHADMEKHAR